MEKTLPLNRTLGFVVLAVIGLVVLADFLFYEHYSGWTAGGFALSVLLFMTLRVGRGRRAGWVFPAYGVVVIIGLTMFLEPGPLKIALAILGFIVLAVGGRGSAKTPLDWGWRVNRFLCIGWVWGLEDWARARRAVGRRGAKSLRSHVVKHWALPVALSLVFVVLFAISNPIIERWLENLVEWAARYTELLDGVRVVFWAFFGVWLWALMRPRGAGRLHAMTGLTPRRVDRVLPSSTIVRCLILFNLVFAVQTVLDLTYLAGGVELPEGMTYKAYARRGAYPLVATALLAGLFVLLTFRPGAGGAQRMVTARRLVYAFLAQNTLLLVSAIWRLNLYIDAYQMTRLRVAAAIWMGLVLLGFLWIILRIVTERSNTWLVGVNGATAGIVLLACCFVNFDGFIADYNVHAYTRGVKDRHWIDMNYLEHLGPASLPALYELKQYRANPDDPDDAEYTRWTGLQADDVIDRLVTRLQRQTRDWRGWTWRRAQLVSVVQNNDPGVGFSEDAVARR